MVLLQEGGLLILECDGDFLSMAEGVGATPRLLGLLPSSFNKRHSALGHRRGRVWLLLAQRFHARGRFIFNQQESCRWVAMLSDFAFWSA